jgi:hypothetical protein
MARQGVVVYPLKPNTEDLDEDLRDLLGIPFVIDFPVGSLDVAASREELSYIEHTNVNINKRLREVKEGLEDYVTRQLDAATTDFDKLMVVHNMKDRTFRELLNKIVATKPLFKTLKVEENGHGTPLMSVHLSDGWTIASYEVASRNRDTGAVKLKRRNDTTVVYGDLDDDGNRTIVGQQMKINAPTATFFLNDTGKRNVLQRIRLYCTNNNIQRGRIFVIDADDKKALKAAKAEIGQAPMISCKTLPEPVKVARVSGPSATVSLLKLYKKTSSQMSRSYNDNSWGWASKSTSLTEASLGDDGKPKKTLYVPLKNRTVLGLGNTFMDSYQFFRLMDECFDAGLITSDTPVYGVRKSIIDELTPDYVNLFTYIKDFLKNAPLKKIATEAKQRAMIGESVFNTVQLEKLSNGLGSKHVVSKFAAESVASPSALSYKASNEANNLQRLASRFDVDINISKVVAEAEKEGREDWTKILNTYPMLGLLYSSNQDNDQERIDTIVDYIKMVDANA